MRQRLLAAGIAAALAVAAPIARAERVTIPAPDGVALVGHWMPRPGGGIGPAVVALHGCGGLFDRTGAAFDQRYAGYAERLHQAGFHVLLPDSFGSRGSGPICTVPNGERRITVETRRGDALAAVDWLASRPEVDSRRIVMLGWSHGATTTLSAMNAARPSHARAIAAAVVFYPGCSALLKEPFELRAPMLMLLGEKDDWTPPQPCVRLVDRLRQAQPPAEVELHVYADSHHGFDSSRPVRFRANVPNGASREGVHSGGNPAAYAAALRELDAFLTARAGAGPRAAPGTSSASPAATPIR
jgi:dienelactone hydrolase